MARDNTVSMFTARTAAATAGTTTSWLPLPGGGTLTDEAPKAALFLGWSWLYETTEANVDNTLDFTLDYGKSATFTALFANGNANGLLDTGAVLTPFNNMGNAASGGATAIDVAVTVTRIPLDTTANMLRFVFVTAGTGTVPAIQMSQMLKFV